MKVTIPSQREPDEPIKRPDAIDGRAPLGRGDGRRINAGFWKKGTHG